MNKQRNEVRAKPTHPPNSLRSKGRQTLEGTRRSSTEERARFLTSLLMRAHGGLGVSRARARFRVYPLEEVQGWEATRIPQENGGGVGRREGVFPVKPLRMCAQRIALSQAGTASSYFDRGRHRALCCAQTLARGRDEERARSRAVAKGTPPARPCASAPWTTTT